MFWTRTEHCIFTIIWCHLDLNPNILTSPNELNKGRTLSWFCTTYQTLYLQLLSDPSYMQAWCSIACYNYCYHFQCKNHHIGMQLLRVKACTATTTATTAYTCACNWRTSVMASFKRQPEKKDALLMRRRGPCSEKARRGLQSWENPAQHKQKHGKEERKEEGGKDKKHEPRLVND